MNRVNCEFLETEEATASEWRQASVDTAARPRPDGGLVDQQGAGGPQAGGLHEAVPGGRRQLQIGRPQQTQGSARARYPAGGQSYQVLVLQDNLDKMLINDHFRTLQQENKELRAALEKHQNAVELIMSKYRLHVTRLVNSPKPEMQNFQNRDNLEMLADKTEKVVEMAAVMKEVVRMDEENSRMQQEIMSRLSTKNKELRELLDISQKNKPNVKVTRTVPNVDKEVKTEIVTDSSNNVDQEVTVTLPMPQQSKPQHLPLSPNNNSAKRSFMLSIVFAQVLR